MNRKLALLLCLAACMQLCNAQNTMESIRQRYSEIKNYIATQKGTDNYDGADWGEYYHLDAHLFLPGTGGHVEDVYMYFNEKEVEEIYPPHYLTFVTTKYNYAAREFYEEYLYDEDGNVAFIYCYDPMWAPGEGSDDKEYEFRFYFSKGKLIKAIIKNKGYDQDSFMEAYSGNKLNSDYEVPYGQALDKAEKYRKMFNSIDSAAYGN